MVGTAAMEELGEGGTGEEVYVELAVKCVVPLV